MNTNRQNYLYYALVLLWATFLAILIVPPMYQNGGTTLLNRSVKNSLETVTQSLPPSQALRNFSKLRSPYDKILHGLGFAVFAVLLYLATKHLVFSLAIAIGYGALLEYIQTFTHRSANWKDLTANWLGALLTIGLIFIWLKLQKWQQGKRF